MKEKLSLYTKVREGRPVEYGYGSEWVSVCMFLDDYPKFYTEEEAIRYWHNVLEKELQE